MRTPNPPPAATSCIFPKRSDPRAASCLVGATSPWAFAPESSALGTGCDPGLAAAHALDINAVVHDTATGPRLVADWAWPEGVLTEPEARGLAEAWFTALTALVSRAADRTGLSVAGLSRDELDELTAGLDRVRP